MSECRTFVMTGATSGLGLAAVGKLLARGETQLVVGARSPERAVDLRKLNTGGNLEVMRLDLSDLQSVRDFARQVLDHLGPDRRIDGIICNAGLQIVTPMRMTKDGVEETFAANHLGHFLLVNLLLEHMAAGGCVVSTASGTHNADDPVSRRFGFRGAVFEDARSVSLGAMGEDRSVADAGRDRYATSKLCNILFVRGMARRVSPDRVRFIAFDPGLMPGTGLAREQPAPVRFAWKRVMPVFAGLMSGVSSPRRSADALVRVATAPAMEHASGDYVEFTGRPAPQSEATRDPRLIEDLFAVSAELAGLDAGRFPQPAFA